MTGQVGGWVLPLNFVKPLSANDPAPMSRGARMGRAAKVKRWRDASRRAAIEQGIPGLSLFTAVFEYQPARNIRRDPENLFPSVKPLVDGLIDAGVAPDDTGTWYRSTTPVIHPAERGQPARMWLTVIDLGSEVGRQIHADIIDIESRELPK